MNRLALIAGVLAIISLSAAITVAVISHDSSANLSRQAVIQQSEITQLRNELDSARQQLSGARQDVITCGDMVTFSQYIDNMTFSQGYMGAPVFTNGNTVVSSLPLPTHCINR